LIDPRPKLITSPAGIEFKLHEKQAEKKENLIMANMNENQHQV
jgi:hypothetical protein